jgi:hypothetical protein
MKPHTVPTIVATLLLTVPITFAQLENGNFAEGKNKWRGPGKVEKVEAQDVLVVSLSKNNFQDVTQSLKMPATVKIIQVTVEVQASADYVFNEKSRDISGPDFAVGGNYSWTSVVHPKCDFHIRLKDTDGFKYKPMKLPPGAWTTLTAEFRGIKKPSGLELNLVFPPGDGKMMVRSVKVEEIKE